MDLVEVVSNVNASVTLYAPNQSFKRQWMRKGAVQKIDRTILESIYFEPGVEALFTSGTLYIKDTDLKIALGLEFSKEEEKHILLSEEFLTNLLTKMSLKEYRETIEGLTRDQVMEVAYKAIELNITDYQRTKILTDICGMEVLKIVTDNLANAETDAAEKLM